MSVLPFLRIIQSDYGAHPASNLIGIDVIVQGRAADHPAPSGAEGKNEWS